MIGFVMGAVLVACLWAMWHLRDDDTPNRFSRLPLYSSQLDVHGPEGERAMTAWCMSCEDWRTFLEVRLTTPRSEMAAWIPNLRFCSECGLVRHVLVSQVIDE